MSTKPWICSILFVSIALLAPFQATARQSITCTGHHLYVEQTLPDGSEACYEVVGGCNGEWTYSWLVANNPVGPNGKDLAMGATHDVSTVFRQAPGAAEKTDQREPLGATGKTGAQMPAVGEPDVARAKLQSLKQSDLKLFYKAPAGVVAAFKRRAGWPTTVKGPISIPTGTGPTYPTGDVVVAFKQTSQAAPQKTYPPHGYPCLGCHPCPPDYCDDANRAMTAQDLSPELAAQGYTVKDGKIKSPAAGRFDDRKDLYRQNPNPRLQPEKPPSP